MRESQNQAVGDPFPACRGGERLKVFVAVEVALGRNGKHEHEGVFVADACRGGESECEVCEGRVALAVGFIEEGFGVVARSLCVQTRVFEEGVRDLVSQVRRRLVGKAVRFQRRALMHPDFAVLNARHSRIQRAVACPEDEMLFSLCEKRADIVFQTELRPAVVDPVREGREIVVFALFAVVPPDKVKREEAEVESPARAEIPARTQREERKRLCLDVRADSEPQRGDFRVRDEGQFGILAELGESVREPPLHERHTVGNLHIKRVIVRRVGGKQREHWQKHRPWRNALLRGGRSGTFLRGIWLRGGSRLLCGSGFFRQFGRCALFRRVLRESKVRQGKCERE